MTGIYFLKDGDEIVYVGKSTDIKKRITNHIRSKKVFDSHSFIECSKELLNSTEISYIQMLAPKYNRQYKLTQDNTVYVDDYPAMTHVSVSDETRDALMKLKKEKGLVSMDEVVKRLLKKCGDKIS